MASRLHIHHTNPCKSVYSVVDIMRCMPCYDPVDAGVIPTWWTSTLSDICVLPHARFPRKGTLIAHPLRHDLIHAGAGADKGWVLRNLIFEHYGSGMLPGLSLHLSYRDRSTRFLAGLKRFEAWLEDGR